MSSRTFLVYNYRLQQVERMSLKAHSEYSQYMSYFTHELGHLCAWVGSIAKVCRHYLHLLCSQLSL